MLVRDILNKKKFKVVKKKKRKNENPNLLFRDASSYVDKLNIPLSLAIKLVKKYGCHKLDSLVPWWQDHPLEDKKGIGLLIWKLKQ